MSTFTEPTFGFGGEFDTPADIDHDPLSPHPEVPTPLDMVHRLTRRDRELRVEALTELAWQRYAEARNLAEPKRIATVCLLFSGGKDSSTIAALFRDEFDTIVHADTGTGVEATRQFVRDTAAAWGKRLVMEKSDDDYFDLVLGRVRTKAGEKVWPGGFPGGGAHGLMQQRLKERATDKARHTLGVANSRTECAVWIAGRRRPESTQRRDVPHYEVDGSVIWCSPLAVWHKADLLTLRLMRDDVPVNPVSEVLGMSGECGCLANSHPGEREMWFEKYPDEPFLRRVLEVESELRHRDDIPNRFKRWGMSGVLPDEDVAPGGRFCGKDCGPDPLLDLMDPLFDLESTA